MYEREKEERNYTGIQINKPPLDIAPSDQMKLLDIAPNDHLDIHRLKRSWWKHSNLKQEIMVNSVMNRILISTKYINMLTHQ